MGTLLAWQYHTSEYEDTRWPTELAFIRFLKYNFQGNPYLLSSLLGDWIDYLFEGHSAVIFYQIGVIHDGAGEMQSLFWFRQVEEKTIWMSADRAFELSFLRAWVAFESFLLVINPPAHASIRILIKHILSTVSDTPFVSSKLALSAVYHIIVVIRVEADFASVTARLPFRVWNLLHHFLICGGVILLAESWFRYDWHLYFIL